jgi:pimeloyl-ACP methyl ester carboxylesterase
MALHVEDRGAGRLVVFTHGWGATSYMFEASATRLAERYRTMTWDLRGHGGSADPDDPDDPAAYDVDTAIADLTGLLDGAGAPSGVLVGHSLGGFLSLEFVRRHPERVDALVLIGTGPGFRDDAARDGWNRFVERIATRVERKGLDALAREAPLHGGRHRSVDGLVRSARGVLPQHDAAVLESLPAIDVPVLVVVGADDAEFRGSSDYMAAKIPGAQLVVIPGAAHSPNLDRPDEFHEAVASFLDALPAGAQAGVGEPGDSRIS